MKFLYPLILLFISTASYSSPQKRDLTIGDWDYGNNRCGTWEYGFDESGDAEESGMQRFFTSDWRVFNILCHG